KDLASVDYMTCSINLQRVQLLQHMEQTIQPMMTMKMNHWKMFVCVVMVNIMSPNWNESITIVNTVNAQVVYQINNI
ncbi:hypothetical protein CU097_003935, partial [Rhizopus azygosporus]